MLGRQDCDEDDNNSIYELVHFAEMTTASVNIITLTTVSKMVMR